MFLSSQVRQEKLDKLLGAAGYDSPEELAAVFKDRTPPAICLACDAITQPEERDQSAGYCCKCGKLIAA
jgi:hypothetical protein